MTNQNIDQTSNAKDRQFSSSDMEGDPLSVALSTIDQSSAWRRFPLVMPLAAVLTTGLLFTMASLIATEFQPQDKSEEMTFQINPVEEIPVIKPVIDDPKPYETVETPPPPPTLDTDNVDPVDVPVIKLVTAAPTLKIPKLDLGTGQMYKPDTDEQPQLRIPPIMPARFMQGDHSGYCKMRFSVSSEGQPFEVVATQCTSSMLERASIKSVLQWKYNPKIRDGRAVAMRGVETKIRFDLADGRGARLPLPSGY